MIRRCRKFLGILLVCAIASAAVFTFQPAGVSAASIADLDDSADYAKASIQALAEKQIIVGDENGFFRPFDTVKRSEMVKMIVEALEVDKSELPEEPTFSDVPSEHWAFGYVEAAYRAGIAFGVSEDLFDVNRECTREEMAAMFIRALGLTEAKLNGQQLGIFSEGMKDSEDISDWAKNSVEFALSTGLMVGVEADSFVPKGSAQRQQVAVVTDRFIKNKAYIDRIAGTFNGETTYPELFEALKNGRAEYKGNADIDVSISMSDSAETFFVDLGMSLKAILDTLAGDFDITMAISMESSDGDTIPEMQVQVIKKGDKAYMRNIEDDTWTEVDPEEFGNLGAAADSNSQEIIKYYRYADITKVENVEFDEEQVSSYTITFNASIINRVMSELLSQQVPENEAQLFDFGNLEIGEITVYINDKNQVVYEKFDFSGSMTDEATQEAINMEVSLEAHYYNIGGNVDIKAPSVVVQQ